MAKANVQTKINGAAIGQMPLFAVTPETAAQAGLVPVRLVETGDAFKPSKEFSKAVKAYKKARAAEAKAKAEKDAAAEVIKAELTAAGVDEYAGKDYKLVFKIVETSRINSKALRERLPEIWAAFTDTTESRPLKVF